MTPYFPYSQLILDLYSDIKKNIIRHPFFGEWSVAESSEKKGMVPSLSPISEIYY